MNEIFNNLDFYTSCILIVISGFYIIKTLTGKFSYDPKSYSDRFLLSGLWLITLSLCLESVARYLQ